MNGILALRYIKLTQIAPQIMQDPSEYLIQAPTPNMLFYATAAVIETSLP